MTKADVATAAFSRDFDIGTTYALRLQFHPAREPELPIKIKAAISRAAKIKRQTIKQKDRARGGTDDSFGTEAIFFYA